MTCIRFNKGIKMDAKAKHDLVNEVNKLKQIIDLLSSKDDTIPFTTEELKEDGLICISKLSTFWEKL